MSVYTLSLAYVVVPADRKTRHWNTRPSANSSQGTTFYGRPPASRPALRFSTAVYIQDLLQPGLADGEIDKLLKNASLTIPKSVRDLYSWRNGTLEGKKPFQEMWLIPGYFLLSLDRSVDVYSSLVESLPGIWSPRWIPLLASGGGDYYGLECGESSADGQIWLYLRGGPKPSKTFSGLTAMFQVAVRCFDKEVFFVDEDGFFEVDDAAFQKQVRQIEKTITE